ncbi:hypothetical protein F4782DRAFT_532148 [Xylaria castorea]|nr:hypothetical protein F4782DRAFT_532148 [Xylaria castorea]
MGKKPPILAIVILCIESCPASPEKGSCKVLHQYASTLMTTAALRRSDVWWHVAEHMTRDDMRVDFPPQSIPIQPRLAYVGEEGDNGSGCDV